MEHFITEIKINQVRQLENIAITLNKEKRQHLLLTGKNGSGKTSLVLAMKDELSAMVMDSKEDKMEPYISGSSLKGQFRKYLQELENKDQVILKIKGEESLRRQYLLGNFISAFFPANRSSDMKKPNGVQDIKLKEFYQLDDHVNDHLLQYMVHLKTQQSYARNEGDSKVADMIQKWFERFESALKILLDNPSIQLKYDYKNYDFKLIEDGRREFGFDELSDGYSSVINIVSELVMRMDKNWIFNNQLPDYNIEGIVLIDELETHLHIELQRKILPFLTEFFSRIQFIVTTHSPYILSSIANAKVYDLEKNLEVENLASYSAEGIVEGYFESEEYSEELKKKLMRYEQLVFQENLSEEERAERAELRMELKNLSNDLAGEAKEAYEEIEDRRKRK